MKFAHRFKRVVSVASEPVIPGDGLLGALSLELGSDPAPVHLTGEKAKEYFGRDNVLKTRMTSINGWPVQRVCVGLRTPADFTHDLLAELFMYDREEEAWYKTHADSVALRSGHLSWFDCPVMIDTVQRDSTLHSNATIDLALVVLAPFIDRRIEGEYLFAMGPDLSSAV